MEQGIQEKLLDALIKQSIEYHARRKIRPWCDCSYCVAKRIGTAEIAYGTKRLSQGGLIPGYLIRCYCTDGCPGGCRINYGPSLEYKDLPPCDNLTEAIRNRIERVREALRNRLRLTLRALKNGE